jgi:hypothetical protein
MGDFKMIILLYLILIYILAGSFVFLLGQKLHTKNKRILMTYYWTVFTFSPVIDLIILLGDIISNISKSEVDKDE